MNSFVRSFKVQNICEKTYQARLSNQHISDSKKFTNSNFISEARSEFNRDKNYKIKYIKKCMYKFDIIKQNEWKKNFLMNFRMEQVGP